MRHLLLAAAALGAAAAVVPSTASAGPFTYGVSSAEVTSTSALLWARAPKAGKVQVEVALDRRFNRKPMTLSGMAGASSDLTVQVRVTGLKPDKQYFYFFHQGKKRSLLGTFKTAPSPEASKTIRFALSGDSSGEKGPNGQLLYNKFGSGNMSTFKRMAAEKNDFNVNLGDTIYSDRSQPPFDRAITLDAKRSRYQEVLGFGNYQKIRAAGSMYNQWDDHEFIDDFTPNSQACDVGSVFSAQYPCPIGQIKAAGVQAFREYMPVTYTSQDGTYRTFRWGKNLEIFILDERSFRSIRASEVKVDPSQPEPTNHVCENPAGTFDQEDPAPQIPQRIRDAFALLYAPAAQPAPQACIDALNDPSRTMLGKRQYDTFTSAIKRSTATWKVVINEVPMMAQYLNPYDSWQGYEAEREKLLAYLKANVKNVAFMTTDFHTNWAGDARIHTFPEEGGLLNSGISDFIAGGVSDQPFGREIDAFTGRADSYKLLDGGFVLNAPPNGLGMQCSNMVTFGYLQVTAAARKLTVAMKDSNGKEITQTADNKVCGPFVLNAK
jgi:phosphodiesterase/alkaline phosphatase D-like protein